MIGQVDAVLLARDDAKRHYQMSAPFLKAGLPVYIDKPLAFNVATAKKIFALEKYPGQIFTGSAMAYAKEFQLTDAMRKKLGRIRSVEAFVMKDWAKYSVHIIDPVLKIIGDQGKIKKLAGRRQGEIVKVDVGWQSGVVASFSALGETKEPVRICVHAEKASREMVFIDTFSAFKAALERFVHIVLKKERAPSQESILKTVKIIEGGMAYV